TGAPLAPATTPRTSCGMTAPPVRRPMFVDAEPDAHGAVVGADVVEDLRRHHLDVAAHEHVVDLAVRPVRGPRAPPHGAPPAREHRLHRRPPEVEVAAE